MHIGDWFNKMGEMISDDTRAMYNQVQAGLHIFFTPNIGILNGVEDNDYVHQLSVLTFEIIKLSQLHILFLSINTILFSRDLPKSGTCLQNCRP